MAHVAKRSTRWNTPRQMLLSKWTQGLPPKLSESRNEENNNLVTDVLLSELDIEYLQVEETQIQQRADSE